MDTEAVAATALSKNENPPPRGGGGREGAGELQCAPACPVPLGQGELAFHPDGDGPTNPAQFRSLQELALVQVLLGGLRAEMLARPFLPRGSDNC